MKKYILLTLAITITGFAFAQKLHKIAPKIIVIGLGEKNPYFDESQFPDLDFYYTPTLKVDYGSEDIVGSDTTVTIDLNYKLKDVTYSGKPEYITAVANKKDPRNMFLLFDKKGICYTFGFKLDDKNDMELRKCDNKEIVLDNLVKIVKKGKSAKKAKKPFSPEKPQSIVGNKIENFPVQNLKGDTIELNKLLGGEATMVVFFNLPSMVDIRPISKTEMKALDKLNSKNAKARFDIGEQSTNILYELEKQFFKLKL